MSKMEKVQSHDEKWKEMEKTVQSRRGDEVWVWLVCAAAAAPSVHQH